jgi:lipopolysaccharide biosynthesis glycosyltransferase
MPVPQTLELACSADARYLPHVSAMLHSALTKTRHRPFRVWLMHGKPLPDDGVQKVRQVVEGAGAELQLLQMPDERIAGFPTEKFHYSCWYRVVMHDMLPQVDRMLYLDCDIIVTDDLAPLWNTDLGDKIFGAVTNPIYRPMYHAVRKELGISDLREYLNSGVLLMNFKRMREIGLTTMLRDYARAHPNNACPEQDALSVLMKGQWLQLHPRWNAQLALFDLPPRRIPHPPQVIEEARTKPAVIHFNGPFKPWHYLCDHPLKGLYAQHLQQTGWPPAQLERSGLGFRLIRPLGVGIQYWILLHILPPWSALRRFLQRS